MRDQIGEENRQNVDVVSNIYDNGYSATRIISSEDVEAMHESLMQSSELYRSYCSQTRQNQE